MISVLSNEEQSLGFQQPAGIGQRPRPMSKLKQKDNWAETIFLEKKHVLSIKQIAAKLQKNMCPR